VALDPREAILEAFAAQLAAGIGSVDLKRNQPEPADLATGDQRLILLDGPEDEPKIEPMTGFILRRMTVEVEGYVKVANTDPGPTLNALIALVRAAATSDRTLGGLLYGALLTNPKGSAPYGKPVGESFSAAVDHPHFTGLEEGQLKTEIFREAGTDHGGAFVAEFHLQYATFPDDPGRLATLADADG
jgi:hypothetical protein